MGFLLDFFAGGTARIQALLIGALVGLVLLTGTAGVALWYRAEAASARAERDVAVEQGRVLASGIEACNAGVEAAHNAAQGAVDVGRKLLAEAKRLSTGSQNQVKRIADLLSKPPPPGADCRDAWREIEKISRKARGAR